jgi:hypothetical protein
MRSTILPAAAVLAVVGIGLVALRAEPVGGPQFIEPFAIPAAEKGGEPGEASMEFQFEGGKPARVIVVGDHKPVADLQIFVYEMSEKGIEGKVVAHDGGPEQGDRVGVVWYPPRTATYRIVVKNPAPKSRENLRNLTMMSVR